VGATLSGHGESPTVFFGEPDCHVVHTVVTRCGEELILAYVADQHKY
jgi:hypothetical protein